MSETKKEKFEKVTSRYEQNDETINILKCKEKIC